MWVVPHTGNNVLLSSRKHPKICLTCNTDPARPPTHLRFLRIPGIQSLGDRNNMEETESKVRIEKILAVQTYGLKEHRTASFQKMCSKQSLLSTDLKTQGLNSLMVCIFPKLDPKETSWRKQLVDGSAAAGFSWARLEGRSLFWWPWLRVPAISYAQTGNSNPGLL